MSPKTRAKIKITNWRARLALVCVVFVCIILLFPSDYSSARVAPKRANYYLSWEISDAKARELAKWDLLILDMETQVSSLSALKKIRQLNPNIIILAYIII